MTTLPDCGLYRTTAAIGPVPAGRLVYFHNHGEPGPGIYTPHGWQQNRAQWHASGIPLPSPDAAQHLAPLPAEGLYRVVSEFTCCPKRCVTFAPERLVQLGYDAAANALLFFPELGPTGLRLPEQGTLVDRDRLGHLSRLAVAEVNAPERLPGGLLH